MDQYSYRRLIRTILRRLGFYKDHITIGADASRGGVMHQKKAMLKALPKITLMLAFAIGLGLVFSSKPGFNCVDSPTGSRTTIRG